jgi:hypothetical protein
MEHEPIHQLKVEMITDDNWHGDGNYRDEGEQNSQLFITDNFSRNNVDVRPGGKPNYQLRTSTYQSDLQMEVIRLPE